MENTPPRIFSPQRRLAVRRRMLALQKQADAPHYLLDHMIEDVLERLAFLRHTPERTLVVGDVSKALATRLGGEVVSAEPALGELDEEQPCPVTGFDLVVSLGTLDTLNDLPGALIHLRNALQPGGLMIAGFPGAGSLPALRAALLAADGESPAARLHPMVDVRAGGQLLQRTGWKNPVIDSHGLTVRFGSFDRLIADLRAQGLGNVLHSAPPLLGRAGRSRAQAAFMAQADADGKVTERFEVLTLSGWRP